MMKIIGLALGITILLAGMAVAEPVTFDVYQGWNLLAVPQVPFEPAVPDIFGTIPTIDMLSTFDAIGASDFPYNDDTKEFFGGMLLGSGYWLWLDAESATVSYEGVPDGVPDMAGDPPAPVEGTRTDMWVSLPGADSDGDGVTDIGGWHMIGCPYNHLVDIGVDGANIKFTDGTTVKTWAEACAEPGAWVSSNMVGFAGGSDVNTGFAEDQLNCLIPSLGYWFWTNQANLAMIVDGSATYVWPE